MKRKRVLVLAGEDATTQGMLNSASQMHISANIPAQVAERASYGERAALAIRSSYRNS